MMNTQAKESPTMEGGHYVAMIGDIAGSRGFPDQRKLFRRIGEHFDWVNEHIGAAQGLEIAFGKGDEFQGAYDDIHSAIKAALLLRIRFKLDELKPRAKDMNVRMGLGLGRIAVFDERIAPRGQSGDAWWNAREAIEDAEQKQGRHGMPSSAISRFKSANAEQTAIVNSLLLALDQVLYRMDRRGIRITMSLLEGKKQQEIADALDTSQASISRSSREQGGNTIKAIINELGGIDFA